MTPCSIGLAFYAGPYSWIVKYKKYILASDISCVSVYESLVANGYPSHAWQPHESPMELILYHYC